jgi:DNA-binding MarR family transcriptional regulator
VIGSELARRAAALEQAGLIGRLRAPTDRRRQQLALTQAGEDALRSAREAIREGLAPVLSSLPPGDAHAVTRSLIRLEELLGGKAPPARPPRPPHPRDGSPHGMSDFGRSSP